MCRPVGALSRLRPVAANSAMNNSVPEPDGFPEVTSPPPPRILERILEIFKQPNASTHIVADPEGDLIVVQGQMHFYRLFRSTGRIERVSDNAVLELNWAAIPDEFRLRLRRECDSEEQLGLRATLLMYDSIYGSYFTES